MDILSLHINDIQPSLVTSIACKVQGKTLRADLNYSFPSIHFNTERSVGETVFSSPWTKRVEKSLIFQPSCACMLSRVWVFVTPWTVAHQAPLSMGFYKQEYWSGLSFSPPGDLPNPVIKPKSLASPALAGRFFTTMQPSRWHPKQMKCDSLYSPRCPLLEIHPGPFNPWHYLEITMRETYIP